MPEGNPLSIGTIHEEPFHPENRVRGTSARFRRPPGDPAPHGPGEGRVRIASSPSTHCFEEV